MGIALTWWNSHVRTVTNDVAYAMTWTDLKKKMTTKYYSRNEIKKDWAENVDLKNKRQNTGRAYAAGNGDKKPYEGTKPLCPKCNFNHYGPCIPTCNNCKKLGHLAKDCRSRPATANNKQQNNATTNNPIAAQGANTIASFAFECGGPGHFKKDLPRGIT
ncbi:putative reverse transcriptase domain-containing protein [Tanacetum coccineum]